MYFIQSSDKFLDSTYFIMNCIISLDFYLKLTNCMFQDEQKNVTPLCGIAS